MATTRRNFVFPSSWTTDQQKAWLEERLVWVNEELVDGTVNDGWAAGDTNGHLAVDPNLPAERRRDMILNDLSLLDPTTYPPRDTVRVTRTVPRYI
jgi:hypothetical protein